ncbi:MAG: cytochrome c oxidase assembly protein [Gaiellaceae bacterium]
MSYTRTAASSLASIETPLEITVVVPLLAAGAALAGRQFPVPRGRVLAFWTGIALIVAAFATRLQPLALHDFLWAHLLQNVVLAEWAPALLIVSLSPALAARVGGFALFRPLAALPIWLATYFVWHLPWLYDAALRRPHSLLHLEHLMYLGAGGLLWWPVIHGRHPSGLKAAYLFAGFVLASPLGLLLALLPRPIYSVYEAAAPTWSLSALRDQQIGGVTMAAEQAVVFFAVFAHFLLRFLGEEQRSGSLDELRGRDLRISPEDRARRTGPSAARDSARPRR